MCRLLSRFLAQQHQIDIASTIQEAVQKFTPGRYDVLLIDLGMPDIPGNLLAQDFLHQDETAVTVLITGWEIAAEDPRMAVFDFQLRKPFVDLKIVENTIDQAFSLHDVRVQQHNDAAM